MNLVNDVVRKRVAKVHPTAPLVYVDSYSKKHHLKNWDQPLESDEAFLQLFSKDACRIRRRSTRTTRTTAREVTDVGTMKLQLMVNVERCIRTGW